MRRGDYPDARTPSGQRGRCNCRRQERHQNIGLFLLDIAAQLLDEAAVRHPPLDMVDWEEHRQFLAKSLPLLPLLLVLVVDWPGEQVPVLDASLQPVEGRFAAVFVGQDLHAVTASGHLVRRFDQNSFGAATAVGYLLNDECNLQERPPW